MPSFSKSPAALVERFGSITAGTGDADRRQMFGYPCLFVGGNLVTGLHESAWFVRLAERDRQALLLLPGAGPFMPMPGRAMGGYTIMPASVIADDAAVQRWVELAIDFGRSLPPKTPRTPKTPRKAHPGAS